jgi:hypothetical protein
LSLSPASSSELSLPSYSSVPAPPPPYRE